MKANESYFKRMQGSWVFDPSFKILSWNGLFRADTSVINKLRLAAFILAQNSFGKYQMKTFVDFHPGSDQVQHTTVIIKFGLEILRSEKIFQLHSNGQDVSLEGVEYYWPLTCRPHFFLTMNGRVDAKATRATYKMPFAGMAIDCVSVMESPQAFIKINLSWFEGTFNFTSESMNKLRLRPVPE